MEDEFLDAAERGNLPEVKELIAKGCLANAKNEVKYTHLSVSFRHSQVACFHSVEHSHSNLTSLPAIHTHFMPGLYNGITLFCKVNRTVCCHSSYMSALVPDFAICFLVLHSLYRKERMRST